MVAVNHALEIVRNVDGRVSAPRFPKSCFSNRIEPGEWLAWILVVGRCRQLMEHVVRLRDFDGSAERCVGAKDSRSFLHKHALAVVATILAAMFALASFGAMAVGRREFESAYLSARAWDPPPFVWAIGRWTAVLVIMCLAVDLINFVFPNSKRRWHWLTPGTAFVVLMTVISSFGLNIYVRHFSSYPRIYGTLAGFIVLMLWIYIVSVILLVGAETDRELEKLRREPRAS